MSIRPDRLVDARPPWASMPALSGLVIDEPRGRVLAYGSRIEAIRLEDGTPAPPAFERGPSPDAHRDLLFTPTRHRAVAFVRGEIVQWDTLTGAVVSRVSTSYPTGALDAIDAGATRGIVLVGEPGVHRFLAARVRVVLVDLASGADLAEISPLLLQPAMSRGAAFLEDGHVLLAQRNGRIEIRDVSGALIRTIEAPAVDADHPELSVSGVRVAGNRVLLTEMMATTAVDLQSGARLWKRPLVALGSADASETRMVARSFEMTTDFSSNCRVVDLVEGGEVPLLAVGWQTTSAGATLLAGADQHGNIQVLPDPSGPRGAGRAGVDLRRPLDRLPAPASSVSLRADGTALVGCEDGSLRCVSGTGIRGIPSHGSVAIASTKFLGDGLRAVTLSADVHRTWRVDGWTLEEETVFTSGNGSPISSPDGRHFLGVRGPSLTLRSALDGSVLQEIVLRGAPTTYDASIALLNGGRHVVGMSGNSVRRWVLATGESDAQLDIVDHHGEAFGNVLAVAEPGGRRVLLHSAYAEGVILWDPEGGEPRVFPGILDAQRVVFADSGRVIVVARRPSDSPGAGWLDRITVLSLADGAILGELADHTAEVLAIAVAGERVVSIDAARQIIFWRLPAAP